MVSINNNRAVIFISDASAVVHVVRDDKIINERYANDTEEFDNILNGAFDADDFVFTDVIFSCNGQRYIYNSNLSIQEQSEHHDFAITIPLDDKQSLAITLETTPFINGCINLINEYRLCVMSISSLSCIIWQIFKKFNPTLLDEHSLVVVLGHEIDFITFNKGFVTDSKHHEKLSDIENKINDELGSEPVLIIGRNNARPHMNKIVSKSSFIDISVIASHLGLNALTMSGICALFTVKYHREMRYALSEYNNTMYSTLRKAMACRFVSKIAPMATIFVVSFLLLDHVEDEYVANKKLLSARSSIEHIKVLVEKDLKDIQSHDQTTMVKLRKKVNDDHTMHPLFKIVRLASLQRPSEILLRSFHWNKTRISDNTKDSFLLVVEIKKDEDYEPLFNKYIDFVGKVTKQFSDYTANIDRLDFAKFADSDGYIVLNMNFVAGE